MTALKTIVARFTELKENVAGTAESEFEDLDYNKVDKALKSVGISIKDTTGQFRNLDEVFLELSNKWNTLDRNSQRYIATIAAGSRQQSRFIAMMEDYDRVMELVEVTQNSQGRSQEQFEKNADSLQFKIQQLKTAWEQFRISLANSDTFKTVVDMLTKLVDTLNNLDKTQILSIGIIGITLGRTVVSNFIEQLKNGAGDISKAWSSVMNTSLSQTLKKKGTLQKFIQSFKEDFNTNLLNGVSNILGARGPELAGISIKDKSQDLLTELNNYQKIVAECEKIEQSNARQKILVGKIDKEQKKALANKKTEVAESLENLNRLAEELGYEKAITEENAKQIQQVMQENYQKGSKGLSVIKTMGTSALTSFVTTSLISALSGADFSTAIKMAGISALTSAIPSIVNFVIPKLIQLLGGPWGVAAVATVVVGTFVTSAIKKHKELEKAELNRLSSVSKANEELRKKNEELILSYQKQEKEIDKFNKSVKTFKDLSSKSFLTKKEQSELEDITKYLNDNYEGVLGEDIEGHYQIVESKMDAVLEELKLANQKNLGTFYAQSQGQFSQIEDREEYSKNLISTWWEKPVASDLTKVLRELETIYGDSLDLNKIFNNENFENILYNGTEKEILNFLEKINIGDLIMAVGNIYEVVSDINETEKKQANKTYIEQSLKVQGWDEESSKIASYIYGQDNQEQYQAQKNRVISNYTNGKTLKSSGFIYNLAQGDFTRFGTDREKVKDIFAELGYSDMSKLIKSSGWDAATGYWGDLVSYADLSSELKDYLASRNISKDEWNKIRTNIDKTTNFLLELIADKTIESMGLLTEENQDVLDKNKQEILDFSEVLNKYEGKNYDEYNKEIEAFIEKSNPELQNILKEYLAESEDTIQKQWEGYIDALSGLGIKSSIIDKLDFDTIKYFSNQVAALNLSESEQELFKDYFNKNFQNINKEALNLLSQIDLTDVGNVTIESSEEYINKLTGLTHNTEEATKLYYNYINFVKTLTGQGVYLGKDSTEILKTEAKEGIKGLSERFKTLLEANQQMIEKGFIDQSTAFQLQEEGFDQYVTKTIKGYALIEGAAEKAYSSSALSYKKDIDERIKYQQELINTAKNLSESEVETIAQYWGQNAIPVQTALEEYKKAGRDIDALNEGIKLNADQIALFDQVLDANCSTIEEYIKLLEEGELALEELSDENYYLGIVAIGEAFKQAEEKVKDLKEELKDLNKTLEENQLAVKEAERAVREAYHGTELYESGLDGLINYDQKLKSVNNTIEDIKENLEDVSTVGEAKDLYSSYNKALTSKSAALSAENIVLNNAMQNLRDTIQSKYGQYGIFNGDVLSVNFEYQNMDENDELKKAFEKEYDLYQEYYNKRRDNIKEQKEIEKESLEIKKDARNKYIDFENDVINLLKEQAQEEVDITKEKYDAIKEADDNYLSALQESIDKQRKLRDKENQMDELTTKEKKLSLLQRDTSGTNAKEIQQLEKDVQQDRQKLLDNSIDDIIENMKTLYEQQEEARQAEIDYMQSVTENAQYFSQWAENIMGTWGSVDDMTAWFMNNNSEIQDMTVEQTEAYLDDLKDKWSDLVKYQGLKITDFESNTEAIELEIDNILTTTSENISNQGTFWQTVAEKAAQDAQDAANKALKSAQDTLNETQNKIEETSQKLAEAENDAKTTHQEAMDEMVKASQAAIKEVSLYAMNWILEQYGVDVNNPDEVNAFAKENRWGDGSGILRQSLYEALSSQGVDMTPYTLDERDSTRYKVTYQPPAPGAPSQIIGYYDTQEEADKIAQQYKSYGGSTTIQPNKIINNYGKKYKKGGLVDYTGTARVDGTLARPEAFLSADDTQLVGSLIDVLHYISDVPRSNSETPVSSSIGDTSIEIYINVENIGDDYDVDNLIERVHQDVVDAATPIGIPVILHKK